MKLVDCLCVVAQHAVRFANGSVGNVSDVVQEGCCARAEYGKIGSLHSQLGRFAQYVDGLGRQMFTVFQIPVPFYLPEYVLAEIVEYSFDDGWVVCDGDGVGYDFATFA